VKGLNCAHSATFRERNEARAHRLPIACIAPLRVILRVSTLKRARRDKQQARAAA
jgi:hypothetical protein